ncbi:MAG: endolytic transglycosylase MltG [Methyloprofundus sp.]|nr:endolytic transglycosylase MltG [Methyloprofundus sp.]
MILRIFTILVLLTGSAAAWAWNEYNAFLQQPVVTQQSMIFDVGRGSSFNGIIRNLEQVEPLNKYWFKLLAYQEGLASKLKAGEYELPANIKPKEFLVLLSKGKARQHSITFPEGWSFKEMRLALTKNKQLKQTLTDLSDLEVLQKIDAKQTHPEGLFFPDSYRFEKNTPDLVILQQAYQKMQTTLAAEWANKAVDLPIKSPYEALILASIVEKETGVGSERPIIAGVFTRRLKKGMRLQTDPTVIYGMGDNYHGNIRKKDLRERTAYNTYQINGLPPTPIAMPGKEAIHAALHPAAGKSLYFVANGDGSHIFSANLKAHNKAVYAYQIKRRKK